MAEITTDEVRGYLNKKQGQLVTLDEIRYEFQVEKGTKSFDAVRNIMWQLVGQKIVKPTKRKEYKVIRQVKPIKVFGTDRERRPPFPLVFPKEFSTGEEMLFAGDVIVREGDMILISGMSNFGKTTLCMNFCGENIDYRPVLMGNEYTTIDDEPTDRFLNRLDNMDWVKWTNGDGSDKFELLPVWDDYAEHIIKDRINIIDWINLPGEYYMISPVMEGIKRAIGKGIAIIALQKKEGEAAGRGGSMTRDFADCELLIDRFGKDGVLLTVGKVKEYTGPVIGRTFAYSIHKGVKIVDFHEVKGCYSCKGKGEKWEKGSGNVMCGICDGKKYIKL